MIDNDYFSCSSSEDFESADSLNSSLASQETLEDKLLKVFPKNSNFLSLVHINAQSIQAHYSDLLASFSTGVVDCVLVSETWLKPSVPSTSCSIPGYRFFRNDRTGRGGGGVGIYLRSSIPASVVSYSDSLSTGSIEYLFLELTIHHKRVLLGVLYCPSDKINYFKEMVDILESFVPNYDNIIYMGDLNTCLLKNDARAQALNDLTSSLNLHILPMKSPTHYFPNCRPSLIDIISVSKPTLCVSHGQMDAPFSHHDLIYLTYKVRPPKVKGKVLLQRNFKHMDLERLRDDVKNIDWSAIMSANNIDTMVDSLTTELIRLYDKHAPVRPVRMKHAPAPWLSPAIKRTMAKRDKAKSRNKREPSAKNLDAYKKLRNVCNRMCRDAKRRYIHSTIRDLCQTQVWRFLRSLGVGKDTETCQSSVDLNALNLHFTTPPITLDSNIKSATLSFLSNLATPDLNPFVFKSVSVDSIKKCIRSISTKAIGSDNLSIDMVLPILEDIAPVITHIVNFSLSRNVFPSLWKKAFVIPLPKTSNPTCLTQYRPISILPILYKVIESLVHDQLYSYLSQNNLLCPYQSGFRSSHSTVGALLNITEDIRGAMDNTKLTAMVLLDFSSAFNSVDLDILIGTLRAVNISPTVVDWFHSYLFGRQQCVKTNDTSSDWLDLVAGVPQGGVLSPLLFSIFINNISKVISSPFHLYADDLQLYRHFELTELNEAINILNSDLVEVQSWAESFGLLVNPRKSQCIIFGSSRLRSKIDWNSTPMVHFSGVPIPYCDKVKNLGLIMDCNMTWVAHVNEISKRMHHTFHSLKRLQFFLPFRTKIMLAQSLLLPILDYADVCYLDVTEEQINKLERLQNIAIRFIFGLRKYDHISNFRAQLKWLPIRLRHDMHILSFLFKILNDPNSPSYLRSRFQILPTPSRSRRPCITTMLDIPKSNTKFLFRSFSVYSALLWNKLPKDIQLSPSANCFKNKLKQHLLTQIIPKSS
ncbi:unnamed protein product [Euphydryas editha]|uniref:Reverse transcriptase domain-containing protein n=1 Tax=Euphydryas editha TaxID=104508 RepID=A0AAU9U4S4_EUPED|nr:unnamed protein product [Euphydryas editha]